MKRGSVCAVNSAAGTFFWKCSKQIFGHFCFEDRQTLRGIEAPSRSLKILSYPFYLPKIVFRHICEKSKSISVQMDPKGIQLIFIQVLKTTSVSVIRLTIDVPIYDKLGPKKTSLCKIRQAGAELGQVREKLRQAGLSCAKYRLAMSFGDSW